MTESGRTGGYRKKRGDRPRVTLRVTKPTSTGPPGLIKLFQRSDKWGVADCPLSMEVFDEHQITADLIDLTVQNQPLIR
jgi:hypothetical protein